jgi:ribonucleoside-triphosphate reductase
MKPETEEVKAAEAEKRAESAVKATRIGPAPQTKVSPIGQVSAEDLHEALEGAEAILFKSPTCPNCKAAMALLDRAGVKYAAVNAADARALTEKYGVRQAPTLVVRIGDGFEKFRGVSDIKGWLMHTATRG